MQTRDELNTGALRQAAAALLLSGLAAAVAAAPAYPLTGTASDPSSGRTLYTESHTFSSAEGSLTSESVLYADASGQIIASKTLDYAGNNFAPAAQLTMAQTGIERALHYSGTML